MKKRLIFILIAVIAVSFSSNGSTAPKFLKKAKDKITGKKEVKKAPAVVAANVVLAKGIQISLCGKGVLNGSITIQALSNTNIPVKNGMFDLILPNAPVFGDEWELGQQSDGVEMNFGTAKVLPFQTIFFSSSNPNEAAGGRGSLPFQIFYSDSDVKGTVYGESVTLKKGWNIVGDKTDLTVSLMCAG